MSGLQRIFYIGQTGEIRGREEGSEEEGGREGGKEGKNHVILFFKVNYEMYIEHQQSTKNIEYYRPPPKKNLYFFFLFPPP